MFLNICRKNLSVSGFFDEGNKFFHRLFTGVKNGGTVVIKTAFNTFKQFFAILFRNFCAAGNEIFKKRIVNPVVFEVAEKGPDDRNDTFAEFLLTCIRKQFFNLREVGTAAAL
jgi:hypothetical protein